MICKTCPVQPLPYIPHFLNKELSFDSPSTTKQSVQTLHKPRVRSFSCLPYLRGAAFHEHRTCASKGAPFSHPSLFFNIIASTAAHPLCRIVMRSCRAVPSSIQSNWTLRFFPWEIYSRHLYVSVHVHVLPVHTAGRSIQPQLSMHSGLNSSLSGLRTFPRSFETLRSPSWFILHFQMVIA